MRYAPTGDGGLINSNVVMRRTDCTRDRHFPIAITGLFFSSTLSLRLHLHLSTVTVGKRCQGSAWRGEGGGRKCFWFAGQGAHYIHGTWIHAHTTNPLGSAPNPGFQACDPTAPGKDLNLCSVLRTVHARGVSRTGRTFAHL